MAKESVELRVAKALACYEELRQPDENPSLFWRSLPPWWRNQMRLRARSLLVHMRQTDLKVVPK
jgi:hypothetical protein